MSLVRDLVRLRHLTQTIYELGIQPTEQEYIEYKFLSKQFLGIDLLGMLIKELEVKEKIITRLKEQRDDFIDRYSEYKKTKKTMIPVRHEIIYNCNRELEFIK